MKFQAKKAVRTRRPLKVSMEGLSGSGKTYTALRMAFDMIANGIGKKLVVFDSENESAGLYADVECDGRRWEFMHVAMTPEQQNPHVYAEAYRWAVGEGYDIIIFDSLSHAWHGALDQIDQYAQHNKNDKFGGWRNVTPQQRDMISTLTDPRAHCIVTMRLKGEYDRVEKSNGKSSIEKIGTKADQRENTEYEFDMVLRFAPKSNEATVEKVRGCSQMNGKQANKPGPSFWAPLFDWWKGGADVPPDQAQPAAANGKPKRADPKTVRELWERMGGGEPKTGADLLAWLASVDAQLVKLLAGEYTPGGLAAAVVSFCKKKQPVDLGELAATDIPPAWNSAKNYVKTISDQTDSARQGLGTPANAKAGK